VSALAGLCLAALGLAPGWPTPVLDAAAAGRGDAKVFEVCRHGCRYRTIQRAVDAAGSSAALRRRHGRRAVIAVQPGRYREDIEIDRRSHPGLEGLTIAGTSQSARRVVVEGRGPASGTGIEAIGVGGLKIRNLWVRNHGVYGLLLRPAVGRACAGYRLENVFASGNRFDGVLASNCPGGRISGSAAWGQGEAGFHVATTRDPSWTVLNDNRAWENAVGYSGTNARYVKVLDSAFFNNGVGIAVATLDGGPFEPAGWQAVERNNVFWNNYDHFLSRARFATTFPTLGALGGTILHYPLGVGIFLYGVSEATVRHNDVFGNYKWGIASLSAPGEPFGPDASLLANEGNEGKSLNTEIVENRMAREGADPNGEYDFFADASGGGNCWGGNSPEARFAPGDGRVPLPRIYPDCPQPQAAPAEVSSVNATAGLQFNREAESDPHTSLGYLTTSPPQRQECSWTRREPHPAFQGFGSIELAAAPGEILC
jgi:Right handed beta helix region